jgi:hypothetical protein
LGKKTLVTEAKNLYSQTRTKGVKNKKKTAGTFFLFVLLFSAAAPLASANFTYHSPIFNVNSPTQDTTYNNSTIYVSVSIEFFNAVNHETIEVFHCILMGHGGLDIHLYRGKAVASEVWLGNGTFKNVSNGTHTLLVMGNTSYGHELSMVIKFNVEAPNSEVSPTQTPTPEPTPTPTTTTTPTLTTTQTPTPQPTNTTQPTQTNQQTTTPTPTTTPNNLDFWQTTTLWTITTITIAAAASIAAITVLLKKQHKTDRKSVV